MTPKCSRLWKRAAECWRSRHMELTATWLSFSGRRWRTITWPRWELTCMMWLKCSVRRRKREEASEWANRSAGYSWTQLNLKRLLDVNLAILPMRSVPLPCPIWYPHSLNILLVVKDIKCISSPAALFCPPGRTTFTSSSCSGALTCTVRVSEGWSRSLGLWLSRRMRCLSQLRTSPSLISMLRNGR